MFNTNVDEIMPPSWEEYWVSLQNNPVTGITSVIDIVIVLFFLVKAFKLLNGTRAWQLLKGIIVLIAITFLSGLFQLKILNYILSTVMSYGIILLIIVFQPELRRGLEQLGTTNRFYRSFIGLDQDSIAKKKENIYKIAIAASDLSKQRKGALIVIERDIRIQDIISTGISMTSEISPQLLVNIFEPNTPLHDGAVVISEGKIAAASCMLPLADDKDIARELGTRHRAAIGISKESDALVVIVSEETGKMSIAKDGTLIADVREDVLRKILLKNLINESSHFNSKKTPQDIEAKEI
ncbi:MAG: diadenylate cyclase CdaA [Clostridia bacterium]|nr:diadenylate cyclase CdaA [Clostridia bacterium]